MVLAAFGTIAAGMTVIEVAGRSARWSIIVAGLEMFFGLQQIFEAIEATGVGGDVTLVVVGIAVLVTALLGVGAWLQARRNLRFSSPTDWPSPATT